MNVFQNKNMWAFFVSEDSCQIRVLDKDRLKQFISLQEGQNKERKRGIRRFILKKLTGGDTVLPKSPHFLSVIP